MTSLIGIELFEDDILKASCLIGSEGGGTGITGSSTLISFGGLVIWQKGGRDIWTTAEGIDDFVVYDNYILATDWDYHRYKFDFDGNILDEYKVEPRKVEQIDKSEKPRKWWKFW